MITSTIDMCQDTDLVAQIVTGDARAFEAIYDRHSAQVFGLAMRVTGRRRAAEEASQDAFLTLWRSASSYDITRGTPKNWLLGIVRNRSIDWLRRERRHDRGLEVDEGFVDRLEAPERTDEQVAILEQARTARQLVRGLPTEQRQVVELAYFDGLTQAEIATRVRVPLGTVKGRQRLALTRMHKELTSVGGGALGTPGVLSVA